MRQDCARRASAPRLLLLLLWATGLLGASPAPARAQEAASPPAAPAGVVPGDEVEEIIVTISKRAESIQEIPAAVSAFDAAAIEDANIQSFADFATLVPNVTIKGGANDALSIRGISQSFTSQSPVALHVNGVFKLNNASIQTALYDLGSIELARGPAGILYGRNATAGALNVNWAEPVAAWQAKGEFTRSNLDAYEARGVLNVPFLGVDDERLTGRFVLQRLETNTTLHNLEVKRGDGSVSVYAGRGTLRSELGERTTIVAHGQYNKRHGFPIYGKPLLDSFPIGQLTNAAFGVVRADPYQGMDLFLTDVTNAVLNPLTPETTQLRALARLQCGRPCPLPQLTLAVRDLLANTIFNLNPANQGVDSLPIEGSQKRVRSRILDRDHPKGEVFGGDIQLEHELPEIPGFGGVTLHALVGWESEANTQVADVDGSELPILDDVTGTAWETWTGEFRFVSDSDGAFDWIVGAFAFDASLAGEQATLTPFGDIRTRQKRQESGFAPFAQLTLRPLELLDGEPLAELELFGGLRYNVDHYDRDQTNFDTPEGCTPPFCVRESRTLDARKRFTETTYEFGARWFVNDEHMLYAKFAHGYKAGLVELVALTGTINNVTPELIDAYEVGWKGGWLDGVVQTAFTAFYYDYTDLQVPQLIQGQVLTSNAAAATIWGLEAELRWQPAALTSVAVSVSHLDASFGEFCADDAFQLTPFDDPNCPRDAGAPPLDAINGLLDLSGNTLEDSPKWKLTSIARHTFSLGKFGFLTPVAEFTWSSSYYRRPFNVFPDGVSAYHRTDLRLSWADAERQWKVEAFVQNLEDKTIYGRIIVGPEFTAGMPVGITPYQARTVGLRVGYAWGSD